ncbi:MAG: GDSL-type esterase/lipase family protein [Kiritimatiellae bacterium]|jgi:lysophospholipase L1-like esterase|nr:GDSL-type esterase/lipase family protein [Kiritimatiellia bacterium]
MNELKKKYASVVFGILVLGTLSFAQKSGFDSRKPDKSAGHPVMVATGGWQVKVIFGGVASVLTVDPPDIVTVMDEKYDTLAVFKGPVWRRGTPLRGLKAEACSVADGLDERSLVVRSGLGKAAKPYVLDQDYKLEPHWAGFGRLEGGAIPADQSVYASYRYVMRRLDSVVLTAEKQLVLRKGMPHVATPRPPQLMAGETLAGNVWISGWMDSLQLVNLYPVLETAYPEQATGAAIAEQLLPKTLAKLRSGSPVKILAWGDSVTECGYLPLEKRWQQQFVTRLRQRFPEAEIEMLSEGWGGRTTTAFRQEPVGSPRNYSEKVLALKPDLIISEFINDAYMNEAAVQDNYGVILKDFKAIGAEWIILTPHYARPDWMGLKAERDIDSDPRPYVKGLRLFGEKNQVAVADASLRWGRLWRQGVPYTTLLVNNINHPDERGMKIFADALMECFPDK